MAAPSALFCANRFASRLWRLHLFHSGAHAHARSLPGRRRRECRPLLSSLVEVEVMRDGWRW
jgi:hypothetical protein